MRRFAVLAALMFWQGGFTFYSVFVVPIGAEVLGSHRDQGFITQRVSNRLNLAGAAALPILAWDLAVSSDAGRWRRRLRWGIWAVLAVSLASLAGLHVRMDELLDATQQTIVDKPAFRAEHQMYLIVSTVQWIAALLCLAFTLWAWREEDR